MSNLLLIMILFTLLYHAIIETMRLLGNRPKVAGNAMPNYMQWELIQAETHLGNLARMGGIIRGRR